MNQVTAGTKLLTQSQVLQYHDSGHVVVEGLFTADDLSTVEAAISELTERALHSGGIEGVLELEPESVDGQRVPRRIINPFHQHSAFEAVARDTRVLDCVQQLIGGDILVELSKLNMKPAKVGSTVDWHQDQSYYPHTNDDLVTTLIYLDDANETNGCLQVLPGRHREGFFDHNDRDGFFAGMITEDINRLGTPLPLPAPAGSVIFMHCMTPHGSLPNQSEHPRRTLIYGYRAGDAFPIEFPSSVGAQGAPAPTLVRGTLPQFARFGSVPPFIPRNHGTVTSLYDLQAGARGQAPTKG